MRWPWQVRRSCNQFKQESGEEGELRVSLQASRKRRVTRPGWCTYTCCLMASLRSAEVAPLSAEEPLPVNELRSMLKCTVRMVELSRLEEGDAESGEQDEKTFSPSLAQHFRDYVILIHGSRDPPLWLHSDKQEGIFNFPNKSVPECEHAADKRTRR